MVINHPFQGHSLPSPSAHCLSWKPGPGQASNRKQFPLLFPWMEASDSLEPRAVVADDDFEELVSVDPLDKSSRALVARDICRITGDEVTDKLIDGVVTLLLKSAQDISHESLHVSRLIAREIKFCCAVVDQDCLR